MYYTIYKITNLINEKYYIGKHETADLQDSYFGSGELIKKSIKKYGRKNFKKEILFVFDNRDEMEQKEKQLVTLELVKDPLCYNIGLGGQGGNIVLYDGHPLFQKTKNKIKETNSSSEYRKRQSTSVKEKHELAKQGLLPNYAMHGKSQSENQKNAVRKAQQGNKKKQDSIEKYKQSWINKRNDPNYVHPNKGKKQSEYHKMMTAEGRKHINFNGDKNPNFGKRKYTNGFEEKMYKINEQPVGWILKSEYKNNVCS